MVDPPVSASYARKARVAFFAVSSVVGVSTAAVSAVFLHPVLAVALGVVAGLVCGVPAALVTLAWPVLRVLWWWSFEAVIVAFVVLGPALLADLTHPLLALGFVLALAGVCALARPVRCWLVAWSWCLVVRHRLRVCFADVIRSSATRNRSAVLPLILWARPTPAGERVWVWLRPGLDQSDLEGKTGKVAVSCWAGEARIVRASPRFAALVRVDLTRRDPLAGTIASPLAVFIGHIRNEAATPVSPAVPPVGLDLADVPEVPAEQPRGGRR
ncbi:hypothetical protein RB614_37500 [Phytohabitans sp. ZYX-F-186]|uniref:DUF4131 domain-containing protein n=1 Tax=Phytohabitans maris TaxID=3071409 RepID=A0ABU0ZW66_9ACTN|nr:hypothetical protein [Phytohabitans sp. ZYX-F-186]